MYFLLRLGKTFIMKKMLSVLLVLVLIVGGFALLGTNKKENYDYLRLHIKANSNLEEDQNIKYEIKLELVKFLAPYFEKAKSKSEALDLVDALKGQIEDISNKILVEKGLNYVASVKTTNEFFPARTYLGATLESGYYDAVFIELGNGEGDNWWCVMYPPLCFVNKNENIVQINYKSRIKDWFN